MKRIRKSWVRLIVCILMLLTLCAVPATAAEQGGDVEAAQNTASQIYEAVDGDTRKALEALGLEHADYQSMLKLSPRAVVEELVRLLTGKLAEPLQTVGLVCAFLALQAVLSSFLREKNSLQMAFSLLSALWVTVLLLQSVTKSLTAAFSAIKLSADFMLVYIPGFAGVVAMSGKPLTSAAYSGVMVGVSNLFSEVQVYVFLPLIQVFFLFHLLAALQEDRAWDGVTAFLKKTVQIVLGFCATVFTGLLSIKGALAASGDSVAVRGIKMLVGSAVPIIGSALGDAYTSVLGSIGLIKNTIGVFGILIIALVTVPAILDLFLWYIGVSFCAAAAGALGQPQIKRLLDGVASTVSLVNTLVIFTAFLWIISTGVILQFRG